jgi:protease-4
MRSTYDLFRKRVADARGLSMDEVDALGRGRVYSGRDAKEVGLVDHIGGLFEAVALVREKAGVSRIRKLELRVLPHRRRLVDLLLSSLGDPFEEDGIIGARLEHRQNRREAIPLALDRTLARLPLSLLFLPQERATLLMPAVPAVE